MRDVSKKITLTLDGKKVVATQGETIWDIAKREGLLLPHLCHADEVGYTPDGNCRACMVEIEGERVLTASCIREASDGMVVKASNPRAQTARKMVMELLLSDQPARPHAHDDE